MPASQLKRLKASLREQGITGQQRSKKQKKQQKTTGTDHAKRNAALQQIRDSFNPFELKALSARPEKFESVSHKSAASHGSTGRYKEILHRPGVSKSAGEEMRRATLLPELQRRNKVGGIIDRRIGEGDTDMTPEERASQRFAREKEKKRKGTTMFDLDASDGEGDNLRLTHGGKSLADLEADDFGDDDSLRSDPEDDEDDLFTRKRRRSDADDDDVESGLVGDQVPVDQPERKKTKKEVMEEVIAKSKLHKYERQKAKEDDDDLRDQLDQGMGELKSMLFGLRQNPVKNVTPSAVGAGPTVNPERQKLLDGADRSKVDKDYDTRLKQLAQDARAKPSERSLTVEEKAAIEAKRLKDLEDKRVKRMRGDAVSDDEADVPEENDLEGDEDIPDQAIEFGLASNANQVGKSQEKLVLDDEDDFAVDEDLIASGSEAGLDDMESVEDESDSDSESDEHSLVDEEEDEFVNGILGADLALQSKASSNGKTELLSNGTGLAFTYPCPQSHAELLEIVSALPTEQLPTVIQRIRALYHPSLSASNKESMANFSSALVDHLRYMGEQQQALAVAEQVIRHLHSLSRTYATEIGNAFRRHLAVLYESGQPSAGDLIILTAIGSIYPTSDHWHQVVTPANTIITRWLALNAPPKAQAVNPSVASTGAFLTMLGLQYQRLSKRVIPEALRFTKRILSARGINVEPHLTNLIAMAELWKSTTAFGAMFSPCLPILKTLGTASAKSAHRTLSILLAQSRQSRRPLELHHHRPQAIRLSIPKFEENFNPDKHYDPDKDRSDARKLQREVKRERKGALRELRKDANFVARAQLRDKRERDQEYERKYRKLVASVQAEEGAGKREWEREKAARKRKS